MLTEQEVSYLLGYGRDLWPRVEAYRLAFHNRYRSKSKLAKYLSYGTITAGILTAISTADIEFLNDIDWITSVAASITAMTAVISQVLSPEKSQRESWETYRRIESLKNNLANRCRALYLANDYAEEVTVFESYSTQFDQLMESDIIVTNDHDATARNNLLSANLNSIPPRRDGRISLDDDVNEEQDYSDDNTVNEFSRRVVN